MTKELKFHGNCKKEIVRATKSILTDFNSGLNSSFKDIFLDLHGKNIRDINRYLKALDTDSDNIRVTKS